MSYEDSRFNQSASHPGFNLSGFLLKNDTAAAEVINHCNKIAVPVILSFCQGFDEWNIFEIPESCIPYSQFCGRYVSQSERALMPDTNDGKALITCNRIDPEPENSGDIGDCCVEKAYSPKVVQLDPPDAFKPSRFKRPSTTPARLREAQLYPESTTLQPLSEYMMENTGERLKNFPRRSFKGKMFNMPKASESIVNDSQLKSYENEYDLCAFSKNSVTTGGGDDISDVIPTMNRPLQVHNRVMGWKLTSPNRRMVSTAPVGRRTKKLPATPPLTLKNMGYRDSTSESCTIDQVNVAQDRIRNRQIAAMQKIFK